MRHTTALALALVLLAVPLVGCIGTDRAGAEETVEPTNTTEAPSEPPRLPDEITQLDPISTMETDGSGTGIWIDEERDLVLSANGGAGLQIFDASTPGNATLVGALDDVYARDVDMLRWDGATLALLAGGGEGIHVVDITDASEPELLATADDHNSHNLAAVPGTPYVYDSTAIGTQAKLTDPVIPVLDVSDPSAPVWHTIPIPAQVNGVPTQTDGCHDITVRVDLGTAYCAGGGGFYVAGGGESYIWDISEDPLAPAWIGVIDNPSIMYHHQALASEDGELLFINDEFIAPNCNRADAGDLSVKQTTAAMWIYDISDPMTPQLLSWMQAPSDPANPPANCGSHFGDLVDDRDVVVWGWYQGGTLLIDVGDPLNPTILDQAEPDGSTWDARYHEGHVYGSSGNLQVFELA